MRADHRFGVCLRWPADARTRVLRRFLLGPWPGFGPNGRSGRFGKILGQIEFVGNKRAWGSSLFWGQVSVPAHPPLGPTGYAFSVERLKPLFVIVGKIELGVAAAARDFSGLQVSRKKTNGRRRTLPRRAATSASPGRLWGGLRRADPPLEPRGHTGELVCNNHNKKFRQLPGPILWPFSHGHTTLARYTKPACI